LQSVKKYVIIIIEIKQKGNKPNEKPPKIKKNIKKYLDKLIKKWYT